jgi:hypothetical protein
VHASIRPLLNVSTMPVPSTEAELGLCPRPLSKSKADTANFPAEHKVLGQQAELSACRSAE